MLGLVLALAGFVFVGEWLKLARESGRPLPPANSPNVLLIVLDTVRADRLSLYGYERPTTPNLERLSKRGIRFDRARATAPWTLASHASMFTGHWPHELVTEWMTPLQGNLPMLAEYLGAHGYATAGFVANVLYCSQNSGLARGFTHYEDYILEKLAPLRTSGLVERTTTMIAKVITVFRHRSTLSLVGTRESLVCDQSAKGCRVDQPRIPQLVRRSATTRTVRSLPSSIYSTLTRPTCCPRELRIVS